MKVRANRVAVTFEQVFTVSRLGKCPTFLFQKKKRGKRKEKGKNWLLF